jgi:hypothetical protein
MSSCLSDTFKNNTKIFQTSPIVFATQPAPQNGRIVFDHGVYIL